MAKKRTKKCNISEQLKSKCKALIEDEHQASIEYSDLADRAKTEKEKSTLRSMANDEKRHEEYLKKMCRCNNN